MEAALRTAYELLTGKLAATITLRICAAHELRTKPAVLRASSCTRTNVSPRPAGTVCGRLPAHFLRAPCYRAACTCQTATPACLPPVAITLYLLACAGEPLPTLQLGAMQSLTLNSCMSTYCLRPIALLAYSCRRAAAHAAAGCGARAGWHQGSQRAPASEHDNGQGRLRGQGVAAM